MAEPASIRYNNPGAMWGGNAVSKKWGETGNVILNDGMGQGNRIAVFPTKVKGAAAQFDLWRTPRYKGKTLKAAITTWSGGNWVPSYTAFLKKRVPGLTDNTVIDDAYLKSPNGILLMKAQAWHEAGKQYPMTDAEWAEAQKEVFGPGISATATVASTVIVGGSLATVSLFANAKAFVEAHWMGLLATAVVLGIAIDFAYTMYKKNTANVSNIRDTNTGTPGKDTTNVE